MSIEIIEVERNGSDIHVSVINKKAMLAVESNPRGTTFTIRTTKASGAVVFRRYYPGTPKSAFEAFFDANKSLTIREFIEAAAEEVSKAMVKAAVTA